MSFTADDRATLVAVAQAAIPPGKRIPGAGNAETLARYEALLDALHPHASTAMRAALKALDAWALGRYFKRFRSLSRARQTTVLQSWARGAVAQRATLRALTLPLKLAHFNDPVLFEMVGAPYLPAKARREKARWRSQIITAADLPESESELEADVVVIGTGAGGAVVAKELAQKGHAVLMIERGAFFDRQDFTTRDRVSLSREMLAEKGLLATVGNTAIALPVGKTVGGSTTVNSGTCFRTPDKVLRHWRDDLGLTGLGPDEMAPHLDRVEKVLEVEPARWRDLGKIAEVVRDGCEALGFSHHPLSRNAPDCDGQGLCVFGCPTDAKRSTNVSYVPLALQASAMCLCQAEVTQILLEDGRAVGVRARAANGKGGTREITVRAPHVVMAGGSIYTPLLLLDNGLCNRWGQVGRHLTIHPAFGMGAVFDKRIAGWSGIPQGYCVDEFQSEGILFEGAFVPFEFAAIAFPTVGPGYTEIMDAFDRLAIFGFMISDDGKGRVHRGPHGGPIVRYDLTKHDRDRVQRGAHLLGQIYFAAGARKVYAPIVGHEIMESPADLERMASAKLRGWDLELSAYHPLGTCRMGSDPRSAVTDRFHETFEVRNLYIVDGSSVPSALGVNPQVTIMAMATRFAEHLHARRLS
jgi:hypothetical protein